jgi:subtilisin family serine protease
MGNDVLSPSRRLSSTHSIRSALNLPRTLVMLLLALVGGQAWAGSIAPNLDDALDQAGPDDLVPVVVLMEEFPARNELLSGIRGLNRKDRRTRVVSTLRDNAERSQRPLRAALAAERDEVREVRMLWGINGVALEATPGAIERLAALPGVRRVLYDRATGHPEWSDLSSPHRGTGPGPSQTENTEGTGPTGGDTSGPNPDATVRGEVVAMGAQQVWNELGYTGAGVIVAVIDTGIDRTHPDLVDHMWTNLGEVANNGLDDDGNGYVDDTWGWEFCLDNNDPSDGQHGTQVAGQVAGDGTNGVVTGMAPDAELMALGIDCDTPSAAWAASDYAIANGAHIITQSYSWWWTDRPDYEAFRRQTDTELAAGVIHANSAGNHGADAATYPVPYNISTPANCPPPWTHPDQTSAGGVSSVLAVGDIGWGSDVIASSSSIGPSAWEDIRANTDPDYPYPMAAEYQDYPYENGTGMGLIKPDLSAYGLGTTSTCPGPSYCGFSGTSSATPHVSGTLALMLSSNPEATPEELAEAILTTAEHRGDPGKNNIYGTGLVQAFPAVRAVESGLWYDSHSIDDTDAGNGDLDLDPGERVEITITVRSVEAVPVEGLEAILSTTTPGVMIHNRHATYPTVPALGTAVGNAPHFSLTVDPTACATVVTFDLELRFDGKARRQRFEARIGEVEAITLLADDFESDLGWSSDPGSTTQGAWVREDPIGVLDGSGQMSNPEDDTSVAGVSCWVTGNGELNGKKDENNNDVDDGAAILLSPPFGVTNILSLDLAYDLWYYDNSFGGDSSRVEVSSDGGQSWLLVEEIIFPTSGWETHTADLFALLPPSDDMRLRFVVEDGGTDTAVEGAVDEVSIDGTWVHCQDYTPPAELAPNPVGDTLRIQADPGGHTVLTWQAPPVDATHDAATLYRVERATSPEGPFTEAGSSTVTEWLDLDALVTAEPYYYRVTAENAGGSE